MRRLRESRRRLRPTRCTLGFEGRFGVRELCQQVRYVDTPGANVNDETSAQIQRLRMASTGDAAPSLFLKVSRYYGAGALGHDFATF